MTTGFDTSARQPRQWVYFPLAWKILLWFFLNVIFVAVVAAIVTQVHLKLRVDARLAVRADERLQALATQLTAELKAHPQSDWNAVLKPFADAHQVQIAVFRNDGTRVAGEIDPLPAEVKTKLAERRAMHEPPPPPRDRPNGAPPRPEDEIPAE